MGEILQDSEQYILQWSNDNFDTWEQTISDSLEYLKELMLHCKDYDKKYKKECEYRIVKETTKQEVVYDEL